LAQNCKGSSGHSQDGFGSVPLGTSRPRATSGSTGHWIGCGRMHRRRRRSTLAGLSLGGVGADRPARMHMDTGSRDLGRVRGGDGADYEMPDWVGNRH